MKSIFTGIILSYFFSVISVYCQPAGTTYGKILYRVNAGGTEVTSEDTSSVKWSMDHVVSPSPYIDTTKVGNKTYTIYDTIVFDPSVPPHTPVQVFKSERVLDTLIPATVLDWNFTIPAAKKIEVRLYFAEIWFDTANKRIFNVKIDGATVLNNYDIYTDVGSKIGVMKKFTVTSDGNLDIDFIKVLQQPKINAIEIIELNDAGTLAISNVNSNNIISAYPNPFKDIVALKNINLSNISMIKIYDTFGKTLDLNFTSDETSIDLTPYPTGIYYLQIETQKGKLETIRLVKQ